MARKGRNAPRRGKAPKTTRGSTPYKAPRDRKEYYDSPRASALRDQKSRSAKADGSYKTYHVSQAPAGKGSDRGTPRTYHSMAGKKRGGKASDYGVRNK